MSHTIRDRQTLLRRVRRLKGQVEALERALAGEHDCTEVLQQIAACRGAINGLMAQVLEGHVREHLIDPGRTPTRAESRAMDDLLAVVRTYLK